MSCFSNANLHKEVIDLEMDNTKESLLDLFIFETSQNMEQLEKIVLDHEKTSKFTNEAINEIFRVMHTIKGSAAMMMFDNISAVAHNVEDLFYLIREHSTALIDYNEVPDLVFECLDFIRAELDKITAGIPADGDGTSLVSKIRACITQKKEQIKGKEVIKVDKNNKIKAEESKLKTLSSINDDRQEFKAHVFFQDGCQMESLRAFDIVNKLSSFAIVTRYIPNDVMDNDDSAAFIQEKGFQIFFETEKNQEEIQSFFSEILFLREVMLAETQMITKECIDEEPKDGSNQTNGSSVASKNTPATEVQISPGSAVINVNVAKLDKLMDLVGELVISEATVTENSNLKNLDINNFKKASQQLHKITTELQDTVMSIRMVPLGNIFQKMHRIVRDMSKKLKKEIKLEIIGAETEADKNIINHLSDPLMHLVRNCIDHGLESSEERLAKDKPIVGTVTLEAINAGNDVLVTISDDGRGLDREKILKKAKKAGLIKKEEAEMTDKEVFNLIFLPGFSTTDNITEYSGRGVGMDVVTSNVEEVGGSVFIDSTLGKGTSITMKIPLTVAIVDGMIVRVGNSRYTIPTTSIKESFRPPKESIFTTPDGDEMIMVRGQCYSIIRLHECYHTKTEITDFAKGIFIMVEQYGATVCLFADELIGQKQVVVKALPNYIKNTWKVHGLTGCTLLGDGSISLILDISWLAGVKSNN
jgi:two-component system chemotaxis sensor kinase CheA